MPSKSRQIEILGVKRTIGGTEIRIDTSPVLVLDLEEPFFCEWLFCLGHQLNGMEEYSLHGTVFLLLLISTTLYTGTWLLLVKAWRALPLLPPPSSNPPISLIIAIHNEQNNLIRFMDSWLSQAYPKYECILILDRCTDESKDRIYQLGKDTPHLTVVEIHETPSGWSPKKWALEQGIQAAQYEWMVFTDADCYTPPNWLGSLSSAMQADKSLILGIGKYEKHTGWINLLIQFETFYTAFQYIGFARMGLPYMGVGRNMAYRKSFYQQAHAYRLLSNQLSGDDDLLVNSSAHPAQTACVIHKDSITLSVPETTLQGWFRQKTRHVSASKAYTLKTKGVLAIFHLSHLCFYVGLFVSMIAKISLYTAIGLYIARMVVGISSLSFISNKIYSKKIIQFYPLFDFFIFVYNFLIVPMGLIVKPEWKKNLKHPKIPRKTVNS